MTDVARSILVMWKEKETGGREGGRKEGKLSYDESLKGKEGSLFLPNLSDPKPLFFPCHQAVSLAMNLEVSLIILKISNQMCPTYRGQT